MASHSAVVMASGFSQTTCFPARRHWSESFACVLCGVMMVMRSTSARFSIFATEENVAMPGKSAVATASRFPSNSATAAGVIPARAISCRWARPMLKAPP